MRFTRLAAVAVVAAVASSCATKKFTRTEVGQVSDKVSTIGSSLEQTQERIRQAEGKLTEVDAKAAQAQKDAVLANQQAQKQASALAEEVKQLRAQLEYLQRQSQSAREQLPWPLPMPTHRYSIRHDLVTTGRAEPADVVYGRLEAALNNAQISEYATYAVNSNGFAVVARLECIEADGQPKPGVNRWCVDQPASRGILDWLKSLVFASPGRFRVIVVAVTEVPLEFTRSELTAAGADELLKGAGSTLPGSLRGVSVDARAVTSALIYEFVRPTYDSNPTFLPKSSIAAVTHLSAAKLWSERELK
jgi:hypothetical protein